MLSSASSNVEAAPREPKSPKETLPKLNKKFSHENKKFIKFITREGFRVIE